jgi:tetratricopeptide (TPR) repeat protein
MPNPLVGIAFMNLKEIKFKAYTIPMVALSLVFSPLSAQPQQKLPPSTTSSQDDTSSDDPEISNWEARLELARVLSYLQRYNESLQEYQKLLQAKPDSSIARREMAAVLFYAGHTEEAFKEFSQVSDRDLDDKSWLVIADILIKQKNYPRAEKIYSHYLEKDPKNDQVRLKLASLLSWQKRYDESVHQYQIILDHRPNDIQVRRRYAQVLTWMGNDEAAVEEWKRTLP